MLLASLLAIWCAQYHSSRMYAVIFVLPAWRNTSSFFLWRCRYPLPVHADVFNSFPHVRMLCVALGKYEYSQDLCVCVVVIDFSHFWWIHSASLPMFACCNSLSSNLKRDIIFLYVRILLSPSWTCWCIQFLYWCVHAVCFFVQVRKQSTSLLLCGCCLHLPEHVNAFSVFPKVYMLCFFWQVWMQSTSPCLCCFRLLLSVTMVFNIFPHVCMPCLFWASMKTVNISLFVWMQFTSLSSDWCIRHRCKGKHASFFHLNVGTQSISFGLWQCC